MAKTATINININTTQAIKSIGDLNNEIGDTIHTITDLRMVVEGLQSELEATEVGTERWKELKNALIDANTSLKNYELGIEALDNEQVASEIKSVVGGLTDMAGGLILVGASGKKMEELVQTFAMVEGAARIVTGAMEGYNSIIKLQNNIGLKAVKVKQAMAAASLGEGVSAKIAAVGMGILNAVMAINPVFLLIAGIAALVAGLAIFFSSTNEAAEAQKRLNSSIAASNNLMQTKQKQQERELKGAKADIENKRKLLQANIRNLEAVEKLTEAQRQDLVVYKLRLSELADEDFKLVTDDATASIVANTTDIKNQFDIIRGAIKATNDEDGVDDIDYSRAISQVQIVADKFNSITQSQQRGMLTMEEYQAELKKLETASSTLTNIMKGYKDVMGEAEQTEFEEAVTGAENLQSALGKAANNALDLNNAIKANRTDEELEVINDELEEANKLREQARKNEEAHKRAIERRRDLLGEINDIINREVKALQGIQKTKIELIDNEFDKQRELAEFTYGNEKQALIDGAIKREETALGVKFINGKINEKTYRAGLEEINKNGIDNLLDIELELLEAKKLVLAQSLADVDLSVEQERLRRRQTVEDTEVIAMETRQIKLAMLKEEAIFVATQTISDDIKLQSRLLEINQQFADREVQIVKDAEKEKLDARKAQYDLDLAAKDLSVEQKKKLEEEYNRDVVQITADAQTQIVTIVQGGNETVESQTSLLTEKQQLIFDTVTAGITQSMSIINDALSEASARMDAERESEFAKDTESLNQSLAAKEISQEQYDNKIAALEQNKAAKELQAKKKAFKQSKAMQIVGAVMQTAQAVLAAFSSAAAIPMAGVALGPIMAGVAGALGAAQIAVIASQQFRAAKGGVVPGNPSGIDSVNSLLAPGEMVINSASSGMFGDLLSQVNQAGGGVPLTPNAPKQTQQQQSPTFRDNKSEQVIKAYVVETDITDSQKKVSRIERSSEF
jgi:hypothetical protein